MLESFSNEGQQEPPLHLTISKTHKPNDQEQGVLTQLFGEKSYKWLTNLTFFLNNLLKKSKQKMEDERANFSIRYRMKLIVVLLNFLLTNLLESDYKKM